MSARNIERLVAPGSQEVVEQLLKPELKPLEDLDFKHFETLMRRVHEGHGAGTVVRVAVGNGQEAIVLPSVDRPPQDCLVYDHKRHSYPLIFELDEKGQLLRGFTRLISEKNGNKSRVTEKMRRATDGERREAFKVLAEAAGLPPEEVESYQH